MARYSGGCAYFTMRHTFVDVTQPLRATFHRYMVQAIVHLSYNPTLRKLLPLQPLVRLGRPRLLHHAPHGC